MVRTLLHGVRETVREKHVVLLLEVSFYPPAAAVLIHTTSEGIKKEIQVQ
jgi:hypothetical protein